MPRPKRKLDSVESSEEEDSKISVKKVRERKLISTKPTTKKVNSGWYISTTKI